MGDNIHDDSSHVLILRLWCEPRQDTDAPPTWRALIEDVASRRRYPVRDMTHLHALLAPCGEAMGLDDFLAGTPAVDEM